MRNPLRELRLLAPYFRDRPSLTGAHAGYFTSPEYLQQLEALEQDPGAMTRLTIQLLEHIALDPNRGTRLEDFLKVGSDAETVFVCLHLNRTVNFVGFYNLSVTAPELPLLAAAIEKNLASRMFKAAAMHRRLDRGNSPRFRRFEHAARAAMMEARTRAEASLPAVSQYASEETRFQRTRTIGDISREAYNAVYDAAMNQLQGRTSAVGRKAFDTSFQGGYFDMLVAFATRHICPVRSVENCSA